MTIKCSDLPELCSRLVESNVIAWHSRKASNNAVVMDEQIKPQIFKNQLDWMKVNVHKRKRTMSHHENATLNALELTT